MTSIVVTMKEWRSRGPKEDSRLSGFSFGDDRTARKKANDLTSRQRVEILELVEGMQIRTKSYVGHIELGPLRLSIQPKLTGAPLLNLIRYAYNLRNLDLFQPAEQVSGPGTFQDLLIHQLEAEARELLSRGLFRDYLRTQDLLASPRGRIDFQNYAKKGGISVAALPCIYHPRHENALINRVILSGLNFASIQTSDVVLRVRLRQTAKLMSRSVSPLRLNRQIMDQVWRGMDRRLIAYEPALTLISLLLQSTGILLEENGERVSVPGFLFDMNLFFQAILYRFLHENLPGFEVKGTETLRDMFHYSQNPTGRRSPKPKPDYIIYRNGQVVSILDAKYKDLWENAPTRDIIYQLSMYALSQGEGNESIILYPTTSAKAKESVLDVNDPVKGGILARIRMRPVDLYRLEKVISAPSSARAIRDRERLAWQLVFSSELSN
jgi:5-methylcytosine-specific restriction enzyme subunit McrC